MLENRYGAASRLISAIIIAAYALMIAVTSTIAIGTVFEVVLPLSPAVAILVAGGIVVAYSVAGGMWSITLTDYLQFLIMTVGIFFLLLPLSIAAAGGYSGMSEALPAGITGLVLAAALAAVMSTASAGLLASSTILANDVYAAFVARGEHNRVMVSRVATLLVGIVVLVISLIVSDVVGALTVAYDLLTGALFVPIVGALFWRRATAVGALASMVAGSVVVVVFMVLDGLFANTPIIWGLLVSLVVFVVVSLLTPGPSDERMRAWGNRLSGTGTPS